MYRGLNDYAILEGESVDKLGKLVNDSFIEGYLPIGGPFIHNGNFHQGVIRLAPDEEPEEEHLGEFMHAQG
jgi:hypothetical protein